MTPRLPPPKPGLAIFQVSPPRGAGMELGCTLGGVEGMQGGGCGVRQTLTPVQSPPP